MLNQYIIGGLFGLCDGQLDPVLVQTPNTNRVHSIREFIDMAGSD